MIANEERPKGLTSRPLRGVRDRLKQKHPDVFTSGCIMDLIPRVGLAHHFSANKHRDQCAKTEPVIRLDKAGQQQITSRILTRLLHVFYLTSGGARPPPILYFLNELLADFQFDELRSCCRLGPVGHGLEAVNHRGLTHEENITGVPGRHINQIGS